MTTPCLTPDAHYTIRIHPGSIAVEVDIPPGRMVIHAGNSVDLREELHDAVAAVLARRWRKVPNDSRQ